MTYALFADMYATVIRIVNILELSLIPQGFYSMRMTSIDPDAEFARVFDYYERMIDAVNVMTENSTDTRGAPAIQHVFEMEQFIQKNYQCSDLSVSPSAYRGQGA